jgi:hypothetical protein
MVKKSFGQPVGRLVVPRSLSRPARRGADGCKYRILPVANRCRRLTVLGQIASEER